MALKTKFNKNRLIFKIDKGMDMAYIGSPTNKSTISVDLDKDIIAHIDTKTRKAIGFTIIHLQSFQNKLQEEFETRLYIQRKAKESVEIIHEYITKHHTTIHIPISVILSRNIPA